MAGTYQFDEPTTEVLTDALAHFEGVMEDFASEGEETTTGAFTAARTSELLMDALRKVLAHPDKPFRLSGAERAVTLEALEEWHALSQDDGDDEGMERAEYLQQQIGVR